MGSGFCGFGLGKCATTIRSHTCSACVAGTGQRFACKPLPGSETLPDVMISPCVLQPSTYSLSSGLSQQIFQDIGVHCPAGHAKHVRKRSIVSAKRGFSLAFSPSRDLKQRLSEIFTFGTSLHDILPCSACRHIRL